MNYQISNFFKLKIAALFYYPPDKVWHDTKTLPDSSEAVRNRVIKELFQEQFYKDLLDGENKKYLDRANELTTLIENRIISLIDKTAKHDLSEFRIVVANPLSGDAVEALKPSEQSPIKWIDKLKVFMEGIYESSLSEEDKWRYMYHLLYGISELIYFKEYPGCMGPAEVKLPITTILDHLYSCASMMNWALNPEKVEGFLIRLDLPGVQSFINASKKVSDLWFSSWFISAASWFLVEELIEYVGPDILITPTPRLNPFYYRWLIRKLEEYNYPVGKLCDLLRELRFTETGEESKWGALCLNEPMPLIPATSNLILPSYSKLLELLSGKLDPNESPEDALARYFHKRYKEFYRQLINELENAIGNNAELGKLREKILNAFQLMEKLGVLDAPPFSLRVSIIDISKLKKSEDFTDEDFKTWLYPLAIRELDIKHSTLKGLRVHGYLVANFTSYTEERWRNSEDYKFCTTCGKLPAFLDIPHRGGAGSSSEDYEQVVPEEYQPDFDEGEHLCPYCLIKRVASTIAVSEAIEVTTGKGSGSKYKSLLEEMGEYVKRIRSTSWYAIYPLFEGLTKVHGEYVSLLRNEFEQYAAKLKDEAEKYEKLYQNILKYASTLSKVLGGLCGNSKAIETLSNIEKTKIENGIEGMLAKSIPRGVVEIMRKALGYEPPFSAYFALVHGDADSMGALLGGDIDKALRIKLSDLLMKIIRSTGAYNDYELETIREEIEKQIIWLKERKIKLVWPSYYTVISRALILSALRDIGTIRKMFKEGGLPIYAGGDDLLVIISPIYAFKLVQSTRKTFSDGDGQHFHLLYFGKAPSAYLPGMGLASRSYSITYRHYKYPLSLSLESSVRDIDEYSKRAVTCRGIERQDKNAVTLSYMPRGGGKFVNAVLPLTLPSNFDTSFLDVLPNVVLNMQRGFLSTSLIYDLIKVHENYEPAILETGMIESYWEQTRRVMERNLSEGRILGVDKEIAKSLANSFVESLSEGLKPFFSATISVNGSTHTVAYELARALWCIVSAIRVKEA